MTKTLIPFPHEGSPEERLMKGMIKSHTHIANELARSRSHAREDHYEVLSGLEKLTKGNEKLDANTELIAQDLQKIRQVLACWKEKDDD